MSESNDADLNRLITSLVMSDLAVASVINAVADKIDAMSFEEDRSLEALRDLRELVSGILRYNSQRESLRYEAISSLVSGSRIQPSSPGSS